MKTLYQLKPVNIVITLASCFMYWIMFKTQTLHFQTSSKPSQIACEPLHHQKAAVMSLIVQLPTGEDEWTPNGASGVAIASALVTVGKGYVLVYSLNLG